MTGFFSTKTAEHVTLGEWFELAEKCCCEAFCEAKNQTPDVAVVFVRGKPAAVTSVLWGTDREIQAHWLIAREDYRGSAFFATQDDRTEAVERGEVSRGGYEGLLVRAKGRECVIGEAFTILATSVIGDSLMAGEEASKHVWPTWVNDAFRADGTKWIDVNGWPVMSLLNYYTQVKRWVIFLKLPSGRKEAVMMANLDLLTQKRPSAPDPSIRPRLQESDQLGLFA